MLVKLADDRVRAWNKHKPHIEFLTKSTDALMLRVHSRIGVHAVLTIDGRVLVAAYLASNLTDITAQIRDAIGNDTETINDIHINDHLVVAVTDNCIVTVPLLFRTSYTGITHTIRLEFSINMIYFASTQWSFDGILVRTTDNRLHWICNDGRLVEIHLPHAENIIQVARNFHRIFVLMDDGTVSYCSIKSMGPFARIEFPRVIIVTKIIVNDIMVFFITDEGGCWCCNSDMSKPLARGCRSVTENRGPDLKQVLTEHIIENILMVGSSAVVQYDSDKVGIIEAYGVPNSIVPCPSLDGERIVSAVRFDTTAFPRDIQSVAQQIDKTYITTQEGHVYYSEYNQSALQFERVKAFDVCPVAVPSQSCRIPSAASTLGDE